MDASVIVQVSFPTGNGSEYRTVQFEIKPAKLIAPPPPFDQQNIEHHPFYQEVMAQAQEIAGLFDKHGYMEVGEVVKEGETGTTEVQIPDRTEKPWRLNEGR